VIGILLAAALFVTFFLGYRLGREDEKLRQLEDDSFRRLDAVIARLKQDRHRKA
jgi:hypothetical protein